MFERKHRAHGCAQRETIPARANLLHMVPLAFCLHIATSRIQELHRVEAFKIRPPGHSDQLAAFTTNHKLRCHYHPTPNPTPAFPDPAVKTATPRRRKWPKWGMNFRQIRGREMLFRAGWQPAHPVEMVRETIFAYIVRLHCRRSYFRRQQFCYMVHCCVVGSHEGGRRGRPVGSLKHTRVASVVPLDAHIKILTLWHQQHTRHGWDTRKHTHYESWV